MSATHSTIRHHTPTPFADELVYVRVCAAAWSSNPRASGLQYSARSTELRVAALPVLVRRRVCAVHPAPQTAALLTPTRRWTDTGARVDRVAQTHPSMCWRAVCRSNCVRHFAIDTLTKKKEKKNKQSWFACYLAAQTKAKTFSNVPKCVFLLSKLHTNAISHQYDITLR